jgi:hypothetical protein
MDPFELEAMADSLVALASRIRWSSVPADSAQPGQSEGSMAAAMSVASRTDIITVAPVRRLLSPQAFDFIEPRLNPGSGLCDELGQ